MPFLTPEMLRHYRRVTVMGIGRFGGGAGVARFFAGLGAQVTATDIAPKEKLAPSLASLEGLGIDFVLGEHRVNDFVDTDLVVANQAARPENPFILEARAAGVPVVTETGLALALNKSEWIGITGSSGKSTTTALIAAMLGADDPDTLMGGNIGGDLLTRIADHPAASPVVVELSSFQLTWLANDFASGMISPPRVAVITNLAPNHLDWHRSEEEYFSTKRKILTSQTPDCWAILNADDYRLAAWAVATPARVIHCSPEDPQRDDACFVHQKTIILRLSGKETLRCPLSGFSLPGRHNQYNAVQAVAAAFAARQNPLAIQKGLNAFTGLPHRLNRVAEVDGRTFYNDSKSTTPEAAITALASLEGPIVLIAGGYDKFAPFEELAAAIQLRADGLVLVGAAAGRLRTAVQEAAGRRPKIKEALTVTEAGDDFTFAVREAFRLTPKGGVVLLSPACASYGMFTNYEERGEIFSQLAAGLAEGEAGHDAV